MDIEEEFFYEKAKENTENAIEILLYLFVSFDIGIIVYSNLKFKSTNKNVKALIDLLCSFLFIDIVQKFLNIKKIKNSMTTFIFELFLSVLSTIQFYLILASLETIFDATKITRNLKFFELMNIFPLSIIFFFITFSYDKFIVFYHSSSKVLSIIQYLAVIFCMYKLYDFLKKKFIEIVDNSVKKKIILNRKLCLMLLGSPLSSLILLITYYVIKIIFLFFTFKLLFIYEIIILKIVKEGSKYFIYLVLMVFLYSLNEFNLKNEINNTISKNIDEEEKVIINNN